MWAVKRIDRKMPVSLRSCPSLKYAFPPLPFPETVIFIHASEKSVLKSRPPCAKTRRRERKEIYHELSD